MTTTRYLIIDKKDEVYLKDFDVHCTDHESNPFGIQWMRNPYRPPETAGHAQGVG